MRNVAISILEATDILQVHNNRHCIRKSILSLTSTYRRTKICQARNVVKEWKAHGVPADTLQNLKKINPILVIKLDLKIKIHAEYDINNREKSPKVNTFKCYLKICLQSIPLGNCSQKS